MQPILAVAMSQRGVHSWGVTNGSDVHKNAKSILEDFQDFQLPGAQCVHTRAASVGPVCTPNAHPFTSTGASGLRVVGMHNGHIANHADLARKYPQRQHAVDSMHIFTHLAEKLPLAELQGYGTAIWWEHEPGTDYPLGPFFSCFGPGAPALEIVQLVSGEFVWASTRAAITLACQLAGAQVKIWYNIVTDRLYELTQPGDGPCRLLEYPIPLDWCENPVVVPVIHHSPNLSGPPRCAGIGCWTELPQPSMFVCTKCLVEGCEALGIEWRPINYQEVVTA